MEVGIIIIIITIQIFIFFKSVSRVMQYRLCLPERDQIMLFTHTALLDEEDSQSPTVEHYSINSPNETETFNNIKQSINNYLLNNKGATADMGLLKDIVNRNISKLENEISALTPLPLYLGLMGTMFGIVIGLFQIPSVDSSSFLEGAGINVLINGVKYAMIASAVGVLFTSILSGWLLRTAKYQVEGRVNELLTFLETQLLPILKEDVSVNLHSLYQNLAQFNHHFTKGVNRLHTVMENNHNAITSQVHLINELKRIDITRFSQANADIFKEMQLLMPQFSLLSEYIKGINDTITKSNSIVYKLDSIIDKTNKVTDIANYLQNSADKSIALNKIVESYFDEISNRNQLLILATNDMEDGVKTSISHFKSYIEAQIESLKQYTRTEENLLIKSFEENRNILNKLNELSTIRQELTEIKNKQFISFKPDADRIIAALERPIIIKKNSLFSNFKHFLIRHHVILKK